MKILQTCPATFAEVLYKFSAAEARLKCIMKDLDVIMLIPIYERKVSIAAPANNRSLRLILILRTRFKMTTTVKLITECPNYLQQYYLNKKSMALTPVAIVVSAASQHYVMKILLDLIKALDLVQKDQVMAIFNEERSVETEIIIITLSSR